MAAFVPCAYRSILFSGNCRASHFKPHPTFCHHVARSAQTPGTRHPHPTHMSAGQSPHLGNGTEVRSVFSDKVNCDRPYGEQEVILVTNDDGIDPGGAMVLDLAGEMIRKGHYVVVCAPGKNNSACGQKVSIGKSLHLRRHVDLERQYGYDTKRLIVYSLDEGTPSDCVVVAIEARTGLLARHGMRPVMTLSGVNIGPNLGPDVLYSGTFAAARQSAMYGIPGLATSLAAMGDRREDPDYAHSCESAIHAAGSVADSLIRTLADLPSDPGRLDIQRRGDHHHMSKTMSSDDRLRAAFAAGDTLVNLNVPRHWNGEFEACCLDNILYRGAVHFDQNFPSNCHDPTEVTKVKIFGGVPEEMGSANSDTQVVKRGRAAVSTLSTWPPTHPLAVAPTLITAGSRNSERAYLPTWIASCVNGSVASTSNSS